MIWERGASTLLSFIYIGLTGVLMKALNDVCIQKYNISLLVDSNCVGVHENKTFYNMT